MFFQSPYTKTPLFVYEGPNTEGSYTKTALFVYERSKNKSPYTETGCFVYGHFSLRFFCYFLAKNSFSLPSSTSCSTNT